MKCKSEDPSRGILGSGEPEGWEWQRKGRRGGLKELLALVLQHGCAALLRLCTHLTAGLPFPGAAGGMAEASQCRCSPLPGWCQGFGVLGAFAFKGHRCNFSLHLQQQKKDHFAFFSIYAIETPGHCEAGRFSSLYLSFWGTLFAFWAVMERKVTCFQAGAAHLRVLQKLIDLELHFCCSSSKL